MLLRHQLVAQFTQLSINGALLEEYRRAKSGEEIERIQNDYIESVSAPKE